MHIRRLRRFEGWDATPRNTMNIHSSDKVPVNTLYGPDDKPIAYMYDVEPIKFGFQPSNRSEDGTNWDSSSIDSSDSAS